MACFRLLIRFLAVFSPLWSFVRSENYQLLLVSFDGFRYDYINKYQPQNFLKLASEGVHAVNGMKASFPTKTFPNHYTLVTGLYPESHGIVDNSMYDPVFNSTFSLSNTEERWWNASAPLTPLWTTVVSKNMKSGTFFWPGSEVRLAGKTPTQFKKYNKATPYKERVDTVVHWLKEENMQFVTLYFEEPDSSGHAFGAFSQEVEKAIAKVNEILGYLLDELEKAELKDKVNLIVTSDHGMTNVTKVEEHHLIIDEVLRKEDYVIVPQTGPVCSILPVKNKEDVVFEALKAKNHPNMKVYKKADIPSNLHYNNNRRIMPIVVIADEGYSIVMNRQMIPTSSTGQHGYDNNLKSMRPIFFAIGPSFKKKVKVQTSFENVDVYPLMCHLINIEPQSNNGSLDTFTPYLTSAGSRITTSQLASELSLLLLTLLTIQFFNGKIE